MASKSRGGDVADYIPELAKVNPEKWGVALCSIDGQQLDMGDSKERFCVQSCSKPISYGIAMELVGETRPVTTHHVSSFWHFSSPKQQVLWRIVGA